MSKPKQSRPKRRPPKKRSQRESDQFEAQRSILFRPERRAYVTGQARAHPDLSAEHCVFCVALEKGVGLDSLILTESEHAFTVMNKFPYNPSHLLVLPRRHVGDLVELSHDELLEIQLQIQRAIRVIRTVYSPAAFNLGLNLGRSSGAGIPGHLHYHIVPRWNGDTNFFPLFSGTKVVSETLEQTYTRLVEGYR